MSNQAALFILLVHTYAADVIGQTTPCTTDSECDYPGCNSELPLYPVLAVACISDICQHGDAIFGYHQCHERPSGWVAPGSDSAACLCPALGSGLACTSTVRQVADFPPLQDSIGQCVEFLLNNETVTDDDVLSLHCVDECDDGSTAAPQTTAPAPQTTAGASPQKQSGTAGTLASATALVIVAASSIATSLC